MQILDLTFSFRFKAVVNLMKHIKATIKYEFTQRHERNTFLFFPCLNKARNE